MGGTTFVFALSYNVTSPTGAGEIALGISPPNGEPFGDGVVNDGQPVGTYNVAFNLQPRPLSRSRSPPEPTLSRLPSATASAAPPSPTPRSLLSPSPPSRSPRVALLPPRAPLPLLKTI